MLQDKKRGTDVCAPEPQKEGNCFQIILDLAIRIHYNCDKNQPPQQMARPDAWGGWSKRGTIRVRLR